jgi:MoaA/NifB/PqqE/SkfB family radical SAM enzyme
VSARIEVTGRCANPCPSCITCRSDRRDATLDEVLAVIEPSEILLGGGDATRWSPLDAFLAANAARARPQRVWVEAPARAFGRATLERLRAKGVVGVLVQIEATGEKMIQALNVGDGERAVVDAESFGLETEARVCVRPKTFPIVVPLAKRLAPRRVWLELVRQDWGAAPVAMHPGPIGKTLSLCSNVNFSAHRMSERGYLPPCALPDVWEARPTAWRSTLSPRADRNRALPACADCTLADKCHWNDAAALDAADRDGARPVRTAALPWDRPRATQSPVPAAIVHKRRAPEVICTTPWTTMEIVDPDGKARQCCSTWTEGDRGNVFDSSLTGVWNGPGYRSARRVMSGSDVSPLCLPICSRLHDRKFAEREFTIQSGSDAFVQNQLLLAEEIADRREVMRAKPLRIALCPSTYCNYNCIMCDHGRTPRRDLPVSIWDELPDFMPTLQSLTFLGGEPLANPYTMRFLREFDVAKWPDAAIDLVTNGSLLTENALRHLKRCTLGNVTVSVNAGTADVYEKVQRGIAFEQWLANLDALLRFRAEHHRWFGITLSFVVQPAASHTMIAFGELARARNLPIRLMALNPENHEGLDFYEEPEQVERVVRDVDAFERWATNVKPEWLTEIRGARSAVLGEADARRRGAPPSAVARAAKRLKVVS